MAHYAQLDEHNVVLQVIVVSDADAGPLPGVAGENFCHDLVGGRWKQTSYNTRGGVHYSPETNEPDGGLAFRKNYAGIGYTYDDVRDAFVPPQPYPSWVLNEETCWWESPVPYPTNEQSYIWNETSLNWDVVSS